MCGAKRHGVDSRMALSRPARREATAPTDSRSRSRKTRAMAEDHDWTYSLVASRPGVPVPQRRTPLARRRQHVDLDKGPGLARRSRALFALQVPCISPDGARAKVSQ